MILADSIFGGEWDRRAAVGNVSSKPHGVVAEHAGFVQSAHYVFS